MWLYDQVVKMLIPVVEDILLVAGLLLMFLKPAVSLNLILRDGICWIPQAFCAGPVLSHQPPVDLLFVWFREPTV